MPSRNAIDYQAEIDRLSDRLFTIAATDPQGNMPEIEQIMLDADVLLSPKVPFEQIQIQASYLIMQTLRLSRQYRAPFPVDMDDATRRDLTEHLNDSLRSGEEGYRRHIALYDQKQKRIREQKPVEVAVDFY